MCMGYLFLNIFRYVSFTNIRTEWNYFMFGHGKGEHDGTEVVIKHALISKKVDNKGAKLQNAHDVVEWLTWKMSDDGNNRLFIEVYVNEVDKIKGYGCKIMKGTPKTQCVLGFSYNDIIM